MGEENSQPKLCINVSTTENFRPKPIPKPSSSALNADTNESDIRKRKAEGSFEISYKQRKILKDKDKDEETNNSVMSSLFGGNPDIPSIPKIDVDKVVETVFSENSFSTLNIAYQIVSNIEKLGFTSMTMVQKLSIPPILENKDALIKSQTGSGKTLAYAAPIIHKLMTAEPRVNRSDGVYAIIIVPTRELAIQSYDWFENLCKSCVWVVPGYLIGGEKKKSEKKRLKKGVNILIATPGRLIDHIHNTKSLGLDKVKYFVIDEADRLLEMGYEQSINSIVESMNEQKQQNDRQTIMLSATLTADVQKLAGLNLISPVTIDVSSTEDEESKEVTSLTTDVLVTPENLSHYYMLIPAKLRLVALAGFIMSKCKYGEDRKMIIFMGTQDMVDYHTDVFKIFLSKYGRNTKKLSSLDKRANKVLSGHEDRESDISSDSESEVDEGDNIVEFLKLHGNMTQQDRSSVFKIFKNADAGVLLCTDVAARGLDLPEVNWIVQYNPACTVADYVHRVGRTARVNAKGSAIMFLSPAEAPYIKMLQDYRIQIKEKKMEKVLTGLLPDNSNGRGPIQQQAIEAATGLQLKIEKMILADSALYDLAKKGYISFVRSYASYPKDVREMFNFKALHLGHYAKSFGLRDAPTSLGAKAAYHAKRDMKEISEKRAKRRTINVMKQKSGTVPRYAAMSEFDSGLEKPTQSSIPTKPKTKKVDLFKNKQLRGTASFPKKRNREVKK